MDNRITTKIIHDLRREKKTELSEKADKHKIYPVKLRIIHNRQTRDFPCNMDLTAEEFYKVFNSEKPRQSEKEKKYILNEIESKARKIISSIEKFSFKTFKDKFKNSSDNNSVNDALQNYIDKLKDQERIGSSITYSCTLKSLSLYKGKISFSDVTPEFLSKYQRWMLDKGNSLTTVGIYTRSLRTIFNIAISDGTLSRENYPFGRRKFEIPKGHNIKKALTLPEIAKIFQYKPVKDSNEERCRDYWVFMYLCNGMNVKDFCLLKYKDIDNGFFYYQRSKTSRTKGAQDSIKVAIVPEAQKIIDKWGNKEVNKDSYVFPIFNEKTTALKERELVQGLTQLINKYMKGISENLGLDKPITTYTARHSFATVLKRSGVSTEHISEALGHSNVSTTKSYLASFEDASIKEMAKALTAFKPTKK